MKVVDETTLRNLYEKEKLSIRKIAIITEISPTSVRKLLKKFNIKARSKNHYKQREIKTYNELTLIEYSYSSKKRAFWKCLCSCGKYYTLPIDSVISGNTKSCGHLKDFVLSNNPNFRGYNNIGIRYFNRIKRGARDRNLEFSITIEDCDSKFIQQDKKCAYSGLPIVLSTTDKLAITASLDRIDSSKGYTKDNIQWIHKDINFMKGSLSNEQFVYWCHAISSNLTKNKNA